MSDFFSCVQQSKTWKVRVDLLIWGGFSKIWGGLTIWGGVLMGGWKFEGEFEEGFNLRWVFENFQGRSTKSTKRKFFDQKNRNLWYVRFFSCVQQSKTWKVRADLLIWGGFSKIWGGFWGGVLMRGGLWWGFEGGGLKIWRVFLMWVLIWDGVLKIFKDGRPKIQNENTLTKKNRNFWYVRFFFLCPTEQNLKS
jgi:hypothetical protein